MTDGSFTPINNRDGKKEKPIQKEKPNQINKYSIYELKSGIDTTIIEENHYYALVKIVLGLISLAFTATAYLYPMPFPQNYNLVLICVIGYFTFSSLYYIFENYEIKNTFYVGMNSSFLEKKCGTKIRKIKFFKLNSEIKPLSSDYDFWIDIVTSDGKKVQGDKQKLDCIKFYDERGNCLKQNISDHFSNILVNSIDKFLNSSSIN